MLKKRLFIISITLLLSFFIIINNPTFRSQSITKGKILVVDSNNSSAGYTTISDALLDANNTDIIYVNPGVYYENIKVNKSVSIISNNSELAIINSLGNIYSVLIKSSNVTFSGFTIKNSTIAIYLNGINNTISDNIITNNTNGVYFEKSSHGNILLNNNLSNNLEAIYLYNSSDNYIIENNFFNNSFFGIKIWEKSDKNKIENNTFKKSGRDLLLGRWSNFNKIKNNNFSSEEKESTGLLIEYSYYNTVLKNTFSDFMYGLYLTNTHNNTILNNTFENNYFGIYKKNADETNLSEYNFFNENGEDVKSASKPPSVRVPSSELTIVIIIAFVLLVLFFILPKNKKKWERHILFINIHIVIIVIF